MSEHDMLRAETKRLCNENERLWQRLERFQESEIAKYNTERSRLHAELAGVSKERDELDVGLTEANRRVRTLKAKLAERDAWRPMSELKKPARNTWDGVSYVAVINEYGSIQLMTEMGAWNAFQKPEPEELPLVGWYALPPRLDDAALAAQRGEPDSERGE